MKRLEKKPSNLLGEAELITILDQSRLVISAAEVCQAVELLAGQLNERLTGEVPLIMCIMNGGLVTTGYLLPRLSSFAQVDYLQTSRYRNNTLGGQLEWRVHPRESLEDRVVVLVDDIFDEGYTLAQIHDYCLQAGARDVISLVLLDKLHDRKIDNYRPDLVGLTVEDHYLFGCGMDYAGYFRHLPDIYALRLEECE